MVEEVESPAETMTGRMLLLRTVPTRVASKPELNVPTASADGTTLLINDAK